MAQFKIGDPVVKIDSDAHGTVIKVTPVRGRVLYSVMFESGMANVLEADLRADFNISDPFERCKSGIFGSYSDYSKKNTTFKIKNSNNSTISSLKASRTLFRAYQFKPLLKFLNSPNRRLLVADEVGLGKTIEAGHIMLELKARKELRNVLIVCPMSLQEKWKAELYEKFGLTFKIVDTAKELINDLNAKTGTVRAIVNYEKIRGRKSKAKDDEAKKGKMPNTLIEYLMEHPQRFSMVLCDEAHKMRNRETQTYKGAEVLMNLADTALFLTATPVMISQENLYNLLHLLDNSRFFRYDIFENHMAENRPFIKALSQVNNSVPLKKIKEQLLVSEVRQHYYSNEQEIYSENTTIQEIFKQDPIFLEIMELCDGEDNTKVRARLQYLFSSMSMMNSVFSRTRKREVTTDFSQTERKPHPVRIDLTEINANRQSAFTSDLNQICINLREDLKKEFKKQSELPIQRLTDALSARPLVYSGGGSTFGKLRQPHLGFRDIIHISEKEWNSVAIKDMDIIRSRNLCPILSTAYGLSISVTDDKIRCKSFRDIFDEVRKWTVEKKPKKYVYGGSISSDGFDYGIDWDALK